ncbi:hypothetical protein [Yinghuangia sp. YIM S10712]|uniref:hypothetical protein n=1 Tax=Yinghuangia sp. YIM S10712 TaxID=3436930 RepID=UPI003F53B234
MNPEHGHTGGIGRPEEAALSTALRDAAGDLMPNTPALVRGGMARGRRMRVARRAQVVVAAAAVVALGGVGTVALSDLNGGGGTTVAAPGSSVAGTPSATPTTPLLTAESEQVKALAEEAGQVLRQFWPAGAQVEQWVSLDGGGIGVYSKVDPDGQGLGLVTLLISSGNSELTCFDDTGLNATCDLLPQPDGSQLRLEKNWEYPATPSTEDGKAGTDGSGAELWSAVLNRPDGVRIYVSASSASTEKSPETRTAPALTLEQLRSIATAPQWTTLVTPDKLPQGAKFAPNDTANSAGKGEGRTPPTTG